MVVRVHARHVAQRGLRLGGDELLVVIDVEQRLGGVLHVPHHDVGDLDGVAHLVVDLQDLAVQRAGADRDLGGQAGRRLGSGLDGLGERQPALADGARHGVLRRGVGAHAAAVEGVGPQEPLVADGSLVVSEQDAHARLAGLQGEEAADGDEPDDEQDDARDQQDDEQGVGLVLGRARHADDGADEHGDDGYQRDRHRRQHAPAGLGLDLLLHAH